MTQESNKDNDMEGAEATNASEDAAPVTTTGEPEAAAETEEAAEAEGDDEPEAAPYAAATAESTPMAKKASASKSNMPAKVVVVILVLVFLAGTFFLVQQSSSKPREYNLTKQDMQVLFQEMVPPDKQQEIATNPEEKKKLIDQIKKLLAVAQVADEEGYSQRPEVKAQTDFQTDLHLNQAFRKKHPETTVSDDQINAYYQSHPNDFDTFLQSNPQFQQRAQGPQREQFRKQYGEFKVVADLARKENLEDDSLTKLGILLDSSQILQNAYLSELGKNADTLVSDQDIEQYYNDHKNDFEEIRVRHVLVSTQPPPPDPGAPADKDGKDKPKPKQLTKEEARQKAQALLERARKGEDFAKLARENTDDLGSKDKGGEYDFFSRGKMVPEFEAGAFPLKPGEISDLVETPFGFHIIKLEERRPGPPPSDPKVRQQITDKMKEQKLKDRIDEIARDSKVVVPEDFDTTVKPAELPPPMVSPPSER
ncbi:MAG TPA: peptidylprolyl isomerase [Blastocatellia bacterium]|nr:peptidylprolyl isomerase [Blastocatellia bacterium]